MDPLVARNHSESGLGASLTSLRVAVRRSGHRWMAGPPVASTPSRTSPCRPPRPRLRPSTAAMNARSRCSSRSRWARATSTSGTSRGTFVLDRMLFSAVRYPGDYGFVPETLALDGDHLDALVILGEPTFPGCTIRSGPRHARHDRRQGARREAADRREPRPALARPAHARRRAGPSPPGDQHFFATYKDLERKFVEVRGWRGRDDAMRVLRVVKTPSTQRETS
jgi:inorganic pyrophosphatase